MSQRKSQGNEKKNEHIRLNKNENTTYQNVYDVAKTTQRKIHSTKH